MEQPDWSLLGMDRFSKEDISFFKRVLATEENPEGEIVNSIHSLGWAYWPTKNNGYLNSDLLRKIADFLEIQNKPFWDRYDQYCEEQEDKRRKQLELDTGFTEEDFE